MFEELYRKAGTVHSAVAHAGGVETDLHIFPNVISASPWEYAIAETEEHGLEIEFSAHRLIESRKAGKQP